MSKTNFSRPRRGRRRAAGVLETTIQSDRSATVSDEAGITWRGAIKINEMHIPLFHVNAFTSAPFIGNPAAVCLLDSWLDDGLLLKVAAENALPATAFLVASGNGYSIRWSLPNAK